MEKDVAGQYVSEAYHRLRGNNTVQPTSLNAVDWLRIIEDSLKGCGEILKKIAQKESEAKPFVDFLNCAVEKGDYKEKRITPPEVMATSPKKFTVNNEWLLIPIKILETSEVKGQFLERRLFILADTAQLLIVDINFRKNPIPEQEAGSDPPRINEEVVSVLVLENDGSDEENKFMEVAVPHFSGTDLGKDVMGYYLEPIIDEIKVLFEEAEQAKKTAGTFIQARERLGMYNKDV